MTCNNRFFSLHAHFYQPPRENPWTGKIPHQSSAWPFNNWNSRIARECYLPNACARITQSDSKPLEFVNNYAYLNFNFGPTLMSWFEKDFPSYHKKLIDAGNISKAKCGHSSAIAQGYNHIIMPLASFQDRLTQALWGIYDFNARFGFMPESLWLPEAAADDDTLRMLIDLKMKYVILSPYQIQSIRKFGDNDWNDVSDGHFDATHPYIWKDTQTVSKDRSIAVFVYDGPLSKAAAFEGLLNNSATFAERIQACYHESHENQLVTMAVDGETFGHHHKYAEMTLAYAFKYELPKRGIQVINLGEYLQKNPPTSEIKIKAGPDGEGTAWSCAHGVRRWKGGCTCGQEGDCNLDWRQPLRNALNILRDVAANVFKKETENLFVNPWKARNDYISVMMNCDEETKDKFFKSQSIKELTPEEKSHSLKMLEMQKNTLFMFTSCGWFFSDVSRIETVQNLRYAARVFETMVQLGYKDLLNNFISALGQAKSNYSGVGTAYDIFKQILEDNHNAVEKDAAFSITQKLLLDTDDTDNSETIKIIKRANYKNTLCVYGYAQTDASCSKRDLAFCYLRDGEEFPKIYFTKTENSQIISSLFDCADPAIMEEQIILSNSFIKITFEDFSSDEKYMYAWILANSVRETHINATLNILYDYLYLLAHLPNKSLGAWAPLRTQATYYARQAADILFKKASRCPTEANINTLFTLSKKITSAELNIHFDPAPEEAETLAYAVCMRVTDSPTENNINLLLKLTKIAGILNEQHTLFYLQNYLYSKIGYLFANIPENLSETVNQIYTNANMDLIYKEYKDKKNIVINAK